MFFFRRPLSSSVHYKGGVHRRLQFSENLHICTVSREPPKNKQLALKVIQFRPPVCLKRYVAGKLLTLALLSPQHRQAHRTLAIAEPLSDGSAQQTFSSLS